MKTLGLLVCGAAVAALMSGAAAGPLPVPALSGVSADVAVIEPVHGCHREVLPDRFSFHYHGRDCRRVEVSPLDYEPRGPYGTYGPYGPYGPYEPGCFWVGQMRVCP
jgi:hypothetical protein